MILFNIPRSPNIHKFFFCCSSGIGDFSFADEMDTLLCSLLLLMVHPSQYFCMIKLLPEQIPTKNLSFSNSMRKT